MTTRAQAGYRERVLSRIHPASAADLEEMIEFRQRMYGRDAFFASRDYLGWMFDHPAGMSGTPSPQWLFRADGRIHGQQAGVRVALSVDGQETDALWGTDFYVDPAHQLRGVGAVLADVVTDATPVTMGIEVSDAARKSFLRAGWSDFGVVPAYVRPLDIGAVARERDVPLPALLQSVFTAWEAGAGGALTLGARARGVNLVEVDRFDEQADAIWQRCRGQYRVIGRRDAAYLNWRYVDFPRPGFYRCFYLTRRGTAVGFAVLGLKDGDVRPGRIVDYLCPRDYSTLLFNECARTLRAAGASSVYCLQQSPTERRAFAAAGYFRRSSGFPMMVTAGRADDAIRAAVTDPANWYVTYGDSNIDHPREGTVYA